MKTNSSFENGDAGRSEDVTEDELAAVIAAIAASEGTSADGFIVRSIKRRKSNKWELKKDKKMKNYTITVNGNVYDANSDGKRAQALFRL